MEEENQKLESELDAVKVDCKGLRRDCIALQLRLKEAETNEANARRAYDLAMYQVAALEDVQNPGPNLADQNETIMESFDSKQTINHFLPREESRTSKGKATKRSSKDLKFNISEYSEDDLFQDEPTFGQGLSVVPPNKQSSSANLDSRELEGAMDNNYRLQSSVESLEGYTRQKSVDSGSSNQKGFKKRRPNNEKGSPKTQSKKKLIELGNHNSNLSQQDLQGFINQGAFAKSMDVELKSQASESQENKLPSKSSSSIAIRKYKSLKNDFFESQNIEQPSLSTLNLLNAALSLNTTNEYSTIIDADSKQKQNISSLFEKKDPGRSNLDQGTTTRASRLSRHEREALPGYECNQCKKVT